MTEPLVPVRRPKQLEPKPVEESEESEVELEASLLDTMDEE